MSDAGSSPVDPTAPEIVIARVRPHVRAIILPTLLLVAVAGAYGYFGDSFDEAWQNLAVGGVAAALVIVGWALPFARWLARHDTITTRRIVERHGVFVRTRQEVLHSRVVNVTVRTTVLQSVFGTGDVIVDLGDSRSLVLGDVPAPRVLQAALVELSDAARRPRS